MGKVITRREADFLLFGDIDVTADVQSLDYAMRKFFICIIRQN